MIHEVPYVTGLYLPLYQHILKNAFDELFSRGKKFDLKLIMRTSSGIQKWIRKIAKPILRGSEVVAVIGYYQEITKNKLLDIEAARYRSRMDFTLSTFAVKKYGPRKSEHFDGPTRLFSKITPILDPARWAIYQKRGTRDLRVRGPMWQDRGELKKVRFDPLFAINHLIRKTWCTTKDPRRLKDHLDIFMYYYNQMLIT